MGEPTVAPTYRCAVCDAPAFVTPEFVARQCTHTEAAIIASARAKCAGSGSAKVI